jgi:hypothetical protein
MGKGIINIDIIYVEAELLTASNYLLLSIRIQWVYKTIRSEAAFPTSHDLSMIKDVCSPSRTHGLLAGKRELREVNNLWPMQASVCSD